MNRSIQLICLLVLILLLPATGRGRSHEGYFPGGYVDARTCLVCHPNAATEVMGGVHYRMRSENPNVEFPGGGSHGMLDRACGLVGSNALVNYDEHCGRCHVADQLPLANPQTGEFSFSQRKGLDCLICHAAEGKWDANNDGVTELDERADDRVRVYDATLGREVWYVDRTTRAAESVGEPVSNEACLRCHHHGQADYEYKRGTPYEPHLDVHAAAGVACTSCHVVQEHKIARGNVSTDLFANDLPQMDVRCDRCHGAAPHKAEPRYNRHLDVIACETCHIPEAAGAERRVWARTMGAMSGPEVNVPYYNPFNHRYEPYSKYQSGPESPIYRWYAGSASMLAEPIAQAGNFDMQPATKATPGAKIYPFRKFISGQPMDGSGIPGMPGFNDQFTMRASLEQMAPVLKAHGLMRAEGLTANEAGMMSMFPNMLIFDRADYFSRGNVSEAVSIGMAKLAGVLMGMDQRYMTREQLIGMGSQFWSGNIAGLDLPDNPYAPGYLPDTDPTTATGSYIKISHAIRKEGALTCEKCHTEVDGRLDFDALGYDAGEAEFLRTLLSGSPDHRYLIGDVYTGPTQCESCHQGKIAEVMTSVHYKFESPLLPDYQYDSNDQPANYTHSGKLWKVCGFPTSVPQYNWVGLLKDLPETAHVDKPSGCGTCHVGIGIAPYTMKNLSAPEQTEVENIDCLVCHAEGYQRKWYVSKVNGQAELDGTGQPIILSVPRSNGIIDWSVLTQDAWKVKPAPTQNCLNCHASAGGGTFPADDHNYASFKRGSVYGEGVDVHADAGLRCADCHNGGGHKMKRPRNNDLSAYEVVVDHEMCLDCHDNPLHDDSRLNDHASRLSCTACHATSNGGATHKDFAVTVPPTPGDPLGIYNVLVDTIDTGADIELKWFNGSVGHELAPRGGPGDGKLHPYKEVSFNQPLDAAGHPIPVKWGIFYKTGNMTNAINTGRANYASMWTQSLTDRNGLPTPPGAFDHFGVNECGGFSISHGITKEKALTCADCHSERSQVIDWDALGYDAERAARLANLLDTTAIDNWMSY